MLRFGMSHVRGRVTGGQDRLAGYVDSNEQNYVALRVAQEDAMLLPEASKVGKRIRRTCRKSEAVIAVPMFVRS